MVHRHFILATSKDRDMKRTFLLILSLITVFACSKVSSSSTSDTNYDDVFFVRYVGKSAPMVTYTNEEGKNISLTNPSTEDGVFDRTIGPVYKGFSCSFSMDTGTGTKLPIRIEVKRNDEPFVVKVEGNNRISYTIE